MTVVAHQDALVLECAADTFADALDERFAARLAAAQASILCECEALAD
jgi:hypothetical protein